MERININYDIKMNKVNHKDEYINIHMFDIPERPSCFLNNMLIDENQCKSIKPPEGIIKKLRDFYL